ncbi:MAG TPA: hypothetical protein VKT20_10840 [Candidatus Dormibacteraeota bacterium]|nr:hypothetical protein [Candidatus Dormibacteraeota bacterium]
MDRATLLIDIVVAMWLVAVGIAIIRAWQVRLTPLSRKARDRYVLAWDRIEARFLFAPQEAVREADGLVMSLLRDRNQSTDYELLPRRAKGARRKLAQDQGRGHTELLRQALLEYRSVLDDLVGFRHREAVKERRRQLA